MDQKRFLLFIVLSMGFLVAWPHIMGQLFPPRKPAAKAKDDQAKNKAGDPDAKGEQVADQPAGVSPASDDKSPEQPAANAGEQDVPEKIAQPGPARPELPQFEFRTVTLGSSDPKSGFRQLVALSSRGAAVDTIWLNDPRYVEAIKPHNPLMVVGNDALIPRSLELGLPQLESAVEKPELFAHHNWQLIDLQPAAPPHTTATFGLTIDGVEVHKKYTVATVDPEKPDDEKAAYAIAVDLEFKNLGGKARVINYELQGPTGLPLENVDNTAKFRDVVVGFQTGPDSVESELLTAKAIVDGKVEKWQKPLKYIGVDVQYFAAVLSPSDDQFMGVYTKSKSSYIKSSTQKVLKADPISKDRSEIGVVLTSEDIDLAAAGDADHKDFVSHSYSLFAGPKRDDVLPDGTAKVIDFGFFHWISRPMLSLLKGFHFLFRNWGVAIICLTIVVRSVLFPLSIRQARGAAKMQELQPQIAALKEKYGNDREKMARAQMELFSKNNYNPLAGCLPVFMQLPIFMGLYQSLNHAVDLRMAPFLWVDNLAAPDALFQLPFALPLLGWNQFNLLPIFTIGLFLAQQKMFMPPATTDEQAMQQKMMNYMTVFMGIMFYKVPAGLCVYFIASSCWGIAEKKLLPKAKPPKSPPPAMAGSDRQRPNDDDDTNGGGKTGGGLWSMLLKAAEKQTSARNVPAKRK